jgi:hypothetical protein
MVRGLPRSHRVRVLLGAILALVAIEGGSRWVEAAAPVPLRYYDGGMQWKLDHFDALGRPADVVFVGSSIVKHGVDPARFEVVDKRHRRAINMGVNGAGPDVVARMVPEEIVARVHPRVVVYGLSSQDLHLNATRAQALERYTEAPATSEGLRAGLRRATVEHLALFRIRGTLRDPLGLVRSIGRRIDGGGRPAHEAVADEGRFLTDLGYSRRFASRSYSHRIDDALRRDLHDFRIEPARVRALERLGGALRAEGIDLVLALTPVTEHYRSFHPERGPGRFDAFRADMERIAADLGVGFVDLSDALEGTSSFADAYHLNGRGAARTSELLARSI